MARRYYSSTAARTTLASGVDDTTTTLSVTAVSGWPSSFPYTLVLDQDTVNEELVSVSARSGTTLTVTRGIDGTTAVAHSAGAAVNHGVSAQDFDEPNAFINGTGTVTETLLATGSVTAVKILDGTITNAKIGASADIAQSKIENLTSDLASKLDLAGGKILQIVVAGDGGTARTTTSTSLTDVTGMSITITPQKSDSAVIIVASFSLLFSSSTSGTQQGRLAITDSSNNAISGAEGYRAGLANINFSGSSGFEQFATITGYTTPATTSAVTYKLRFGVDASTTSMTLRNNFNAGRLYAIEVSA